MRSRSEISNTSAGSGLAGAVGTGVAGARVGACEGVGSDRFVGAGLIGAAVAAEAEGVGAAEVATALGPGVGVWVAADVGVGELVGI